VSAAVVVVKEMAGVERVNGTLDYFPQRQGCFLPFVENLEAVDFLTVVGT
jgi:hypothetical protein